MLTFPNLCTLSFYLCVPGDELKYTGDKKKGPRQVVTSEEMVKDILRQYHSNPLGGHSGINNTLDKIGRLYYWVGMKGDVKEYVSYWF